jgi:hypothetical protein
MNFENVTAAQYFQLQKKAAENSADKPAFKELVDHLRGTPRLRERLIFEILGMVWQKLLRGEDPGLLIVPAISWSDYLSPERLLEYLTTLERIAVEAFKLMESAKHTPGAFPPFYVCLNDSLRLLRRRNPARFKEIITKLDLENSNGTESPRRKVIQALT